MEWQGDTLLRRLTENVNEAVLRTALAVAGHARRGASVPVGKGPGGRKIRSKPGEHPRRDTSAYVQSITVDKAAGEPRALIGSPLPHAGYLMRGTSKMRVRPNLQKALEAEATAHRERVIAAVRASLSSIRS